MRVAYLAAGAGGMYCGSCIHDNAISKAMIRLGHEVALLPAYTPMRLDEESVASERVFYGALNVYLQQKSALFRKSPRLLDRMLDRPGLLRWISRKFAASTDARDLGELTLSVLQGEAGAQAKELDKLVRWLADEYRPDVVQITNSLLLGLARRIRQEVGVPVVVQVQGEDIFLDELPNRERVVREMRERAADVDRFVAPNRFYAEKMSRLLELPAERMRVVPLGIDLAGHRSDAGFGDAAATPARDADREPAIGYLARICPEKGVQHLVDAFRILAAEPGHERLRLRIAGWLGARDREWFERLQSRIEGWGLAHRVDTVGEVDFAGKTAFLNSIDLLSVPTVYHEAKGLYVLEALAHGVPVVQPRHGSFPELVEATGGGLLVEPDSAQALAAGLRELLADPERARRMGRGGRRAVEERFTDTAMARSMLSLYAELVGGAG